MARTRRNGLINDVAAGIDETLGVPTLVSVVRYINDSLRPAVSQLQTDVDFMWVIVFGDPPQDDEPAETPTGDDGVQADLAVLQGQFLQVQKQWQELLTRMYEAGGLTPDACRRTLARWMLERPGDFDLAALGVTPPTRTGTVGKADALTLPDPGELLP